MSEERKRAVTPEEAYLAIEEGFFGVLGERVAGRAGAGANRP